LAQAILAQDAVAQSSDRSVFAFYLA